MDGTNASKRNVLNKMIQYKGKLKQKTTATQEVHKNQIPLLSC